MSAYVTEARMDLRRLEEWKVTQVMRESNGEVNMLAKLGASPKRAEGKWIRIENQELPTRIEEASGGECRVITAGDRRTPSQSS